MLNRTHLIIGLGEIGTALSKIIREKRKVVTYDIKKSTPHDGKRIYIMHICFPFAENFIKDVIKYAKIYKPKYVVIHSTVAVGITETIGLKLKTIPVFHSPVRGKHPELVSDVKKYIKYISFEGTEVYQAQEVGQEFERLGIQTKVLPETKSTELGKLLSLARYGVYLAFAKEQEAICKAFGVSNNIVSDFESTRNAGVKEDLKQPLLYPFQKYVGGHCVVENMGLLLAQLHGYSNIKTPLLDNSLIIDRGTIIWNNCNIYPTAKIGKGVSIGTGTEIGPEVNIGDNSRIGAHCFIPENISIGRDVFIGPGVAFSNDLYPPSHKEHWAKTVVGDEVSIGIRSVILPGITIGSRAVIGAGSVVTKDIGPGEKWYGIAAVKHGTRDDCYSMEERRDKENG